MKKTKFLIIIPILGYAVGIMLDAFLFLPLFLLTLYLAILYVVLFALLKKAMLRSSQVEFKKKEGIYKITVFIYSVCLFFGLWAINKYLLPHKLHMLSLATDAVLVGLTLFLGFCIAKQKSARDVLAGVVIFIILFCLAVAPGALTPRYVETSSFEALKSLPYLTWVPAKEGINKKGVTINKHELSYWGLNLFSYDGESEAYLMDSLGNVVHSWSGTSGAWHHVELCSDGALLVVTEDRALLKLDFNSNIVWMNDDRRFHHDISISENGDIYTLARKERFVLKHGVPFPVLDDYIVILSGAGEIEKEISLYELLKEDVSFGTIFKIYAWMARPNILMELILNKMDKGYAFLGWIGCAGDIFHANTVGVIGSETNGLTKEGYLLVCARNLDLVGILDLSKKGSSLSGGQGISVCRIIRRFCITGTSLSLITAGKESIHAW